MSSNVGLSTPRGSGTSGYVQRNFAFMKPRTAGYGAPYPPVSSGANATDPGRPFKQRMPDRQILEHDRRRAVEVKVMEERERLEEVNERLEEEMEGKEDGDEGVDKKGEEEGKEKERILTDEEIDERCEALREKLLKELEADEAREQQRGQQQPASRKGWGRDLPPKERRQFKSYQVHEQAEAKIEESERLRRALGIREDRETGELSSGFRRRDSEGRKREGDRERY
ncbi:U2-type spliceosomal complex subunit CWC21 [Aspergillus melleus]|uniref:U2-type spliceosomal complex subunit CWC21 n=1 Tax=Aspergillus melleus TaxID=138277 RepID=UPI001E8E66D4|nr:RNA-splicing factor [Aspergillus melleus]KAH8431326.1 RNA-splicing factor [Aspergillus melleus]